jgi:hypothetical protein
LAEDEVSLDEVLPLTDSNQLDGSAGESSVITRNTPGPCQAVTREILSGPREALKIANESCSMDSGYKNHKLLKVCGAKNTSVKRKCGEKDTRWRWQCVDFNTLKGRSEIVINKDENKRGDEDALPYHRNVITAKVIGTNVDPCKTPPVNESSYSLVATPRPYTRDNEYNCESVSKNPIVDEYLRLSELYRNDLDYCDVIKYMGTSLKDPRTYEEAMQSERREEWLSAIENEYNNLKRRGVLVEVPRPRGNIRLVDSKLVFKTKIKNNKIVKYKVRLVARGFTQVPEEDYNETFAPVARTNSLRLFLKVSVVKKHKRKMLDVVAAYLYGKLNEDIYLKTPANWKCKPGNVLKMKHALYGTKQGGRSWYQLLKDYNLKVLNMKMSESDNCIFFREDYSVMMLVYVDDMIISYKNESDYLNLIDRIKRDFEIGEEGPIDWYLGIKLIDQGNKIMMNQTEYIEKIIEKYKVKNTSNTPMIINYAIEKSKEDTLDEKLDIKSKIGSLMFAAVSTRPDIMFAVTYLSRFTNHPTKEVDTAIMRVFEYLNATKEFGINLNEGKCYLEIFCDADLGGDINDDKSTSGGCELIDGDIINWWSTKQTITAQSTCDSEGISMNVGCKNMMWTRGLLEELGHRQSDPTPIYCDNSSAVQLVYNPVFHKRSKHLRLKLRLIKDLVEQEQARVLKIETKDNVSDIFTKSQDRKRFYTNVNGLNMIPEDDANAKRILRK